MENGEKISTWECLVDVVGMLNNDLKVTADRLGISEDEVDQLIQRRLEFSSELKTKVLKLFIKLEENPDLWVGEPTDAMDRAVNMDLMKEVVFVEGDRRSTVTRFPVR